jgi:hypothetical protein
MNGWFGPILVLLLFSTSALVCGTIVFYKPYKLFLRGKGTDAANVVISTVFWLFVLLLVSFLALFLTKG